MQSQHRLNYCIRNVSVWILLGSFRVNCEIQSFRPAKSVHLFTSKALNLFFGKEKLYKKRFEKFGKHSLYECVSLIVQAIGFEPLQRTIFVQKHAKYEYLLTIQIAKGTTLYECCESNWTNNGITTASWQYRCSQWVEENLEAVTVCSWITSITQQKLTKKVMVLVDLFFAP